MGIIQNNIDKEVTCMIFVPPKFRIKIDGSFLFLRSRPSQKT
jgi:hypothetical protein